MALVATSTALCQSITLTASNRQPSGWGADGWGGFRFVFKNAGSADAQALSWTAHWEAGGKKIGDDFGGEANLALPSGQEVSKDEVGVLPANVAALAKPGAAAIVGVFRVLEGGTERSLPFRIEVPEYVLPEKLKLVKGKTAGIQVMESRFKTFKHLDRTLRWIDQAYAAMIDLTGEHPFDGKLMVFKEAPPHPWWAYAGQEMILNTNFVEATLKDFDDGIIAFGWVHEVGHNFDVLGDWYIWDGPSAEFQANFKLAYALENMADQSYRINWKWQAVEYPAPDKQVRLRGTELVEKFFLVFGDKYLGDNTRAWTTMASDDIHSFFQRLQRVYGWEPFRAWYRTYRQLAAKGVKAPGTPEEKVSLIAAILSKECKVDLVPAFQRWRFPVSKESVTAASAKYGVGTSRE